MLIENRFYINRNGRAVRIGDFVSNGDHGEQERVNLDDPDVVEEEQRIAASTPDDMEIRTYLLNKIYKTRKSANHAVRNVSFGISFGECFALLGINGAGKTSTFKALTGDVDPTSGEVHVGGYDVQNRIQYNHIRKLIGYCPQFDAIFPNLTVKEHLEFYANIKGVIPNMRRTVVERQLVEMGLEEYTNKQAGKLSGGNKRKLSVAMAMIGNPPIVFLDEPSTGMDPKAKRFMWNIIAKISTLRKKSCVILTTHSMEEAEALSTKLGIMVGGSFKCFGSAQHIKNKFGDGYEVEIKITTPTSEELTALGTGKGFQEEMLVNESNYMQVLTAFEAQPLSGEIKEGGFGENMWKEFGKGGIKLRSFIEFIFIEQAGLSLMNQLANDFEYVELLEHYGNSFRVKLPTFNQSIGVLFGRFEEIYKPQFSIDQYSVSQTTLEQIFNNFAKQHYTLSKTSRIFRKQA